MICKDVKGIGMLAVLDITLDILRYYHIILDRKYLVGSGDLEGIKRLGLEQYVKIHIIGDLNLKYIEKYYLPF